jgi:hypothetical protein
VIKVTCAPSRLGLRHWIVQQVLGDWLGQECVVDTADGATSWQLSLTDHHGYLNLADTFLSLPEPQWLDQSGLPALPLPAWKRTEDLTRDGSSSPLPILYGRSRVDGQWVSQHNSQLTVQADLLGSITFLLGRYEQYAVTERDKYDRLTAAASIIGKPELLDRPLADEYAELLWALLLRDWPRLTRPAPQYRLCPTHDVDFPLAVYGRGWKRHLRSVAADITVRDDAALALKRLQAIPRVAQGDLSADVNNTFGWMMDQSERRNLQSTFYFLVDDANYDLSLPFIAELLREIHTRGHRIGVHPPLGTYRDGAAMLAAVQRFRATLRDAGLAELADSALPGRQHFLQHAVPETWQLYAQAGLGLDSSAAFADRAGFACGTCHRFAPADLRAGEPIALRVAPLIAMEASLFSPRYEHLSWKDGIAKLARLSQACRSVNGEFVLLWHNSSLITRQQRAAYVATLDASV